MKGSIKISKPRQLHNTHFGLICPAETPEGQKIGIVKNLALMAKVSLGYSSEDQQNIKEILVTIGMEIFDHFIDPSTIPDKTKIFMNGDWIGFTDQAESLIR
jgi:DNA-directed RNA polymerase II subunit RPB2